MRTTGPGSPRASRRLNATVLLVQAVVAFAAVPLAHAALVDRSPPAEAHVEAPGNPACPTSHYEANCLGCSLLRVASHPPAGPALPALAHRDAGIAPAHPTLVPVVIRSAPLGGRAPPA